MRNNLNKFAYIIYAAIRRVLATSGYQETPVGHFHILELRTSTQFMYL